MPADVHRALATLLTELVDGAAAETCWVLNPSDPGLLRSLEKLSASAASAQPSGGGASIAAHVDHVRYGLELLNRWSRGENPFADADFSASWRRQAVTAEEWLTLQDRLGREAHAWMKAAAMPRDMNQIELTGILAGVAHIAYHLGAIRQIDRSIRGPAETGRVGASP
jgi:hypothetical protein